MKHPILLSKGEFVVSMSAGNTGYSGGHGHNLYAITNWGNLWVFDRSRKQWHRLGDRNTEEDIHPERMY